MTQNNLSYSKGNTSNSLNDINTTFKVVVRVRPPLPRELEGGRFISTVKFEQFAKTLTSDIRSKSRKTTKKSQFMSTTTSMPLTQHMFKNTQRLPICTQFTRLDSIGSMTKTQHNSRSTKTQQKQPFSRLYKYFQNQSSQILIVIV